jgi:beta-phosphoglucomutase-like phosphatase (HAD superfamily)
VEDSLVGLKAAVAAKMRLVLLFDDVGAILEIDAYCLSRYGAFRLIN